MPHLLLKRVEFQDFKILLHTSLLFKTEPILSEVVLHLSNEHLGLVLLVDGDDLLKVQLHR